MQAKTPQHLNTNPNPPPPTMSPLEEMQQANINRSIRTIKAELEYLCDASIITPETLSDLLSRIPSQTQLHAPISVGALPNPPTPAPAPGLSHRSHSSLNTSNSLNEKQEPNNYFPRATSPQPPPPAYNSAPPPPAQWAPSAPPLATATALYAYTSTDAGDLELQPNDSVTVTEYMNAEWWKGKCARTGLEGIFPRSYVKVDEKEAGGGGNSYGNMPLSVSGMGNGEFFPQKIRSRFCDSECATSGLTLFRVCVTGESKVPSKGEEQGKKFGKKLGNAAIFGAGATIGGKVVNSIF